jgi:hypothetical protein
VRVTSRSTLTLSGVVWANNTSDSDGGEIHLSAAGDLLVDSPLHANGGGAGYFAGYGGVVTVASDAGAVDVLDAIEANGASPDGEGGVVQVTTAGALSMLATVDAKGVGIGGTGGYVKLRGGASVLVDASVDASGGAYDGGAVTVWSRGPVDVLQPLFASGGGTYYYGNGDGGLVSVHSDQGPLTTAGRLVAQGGSPDGSGGVVSVTSQGGVSVGGALEASSAGSGSGSGGEIRVHGGGSVSFDATIDASGGDGGGGAVTITTGGDLEALGLVDVNGGGGGDGGTASLTAGSAATLTDQVSANGLGGGGGGAIEVRACEVALESSARLDAAEPGGTTEIVVLLGGNVDGDLVAGLSNTVAWGPWATAPVFGATSSRTPAELAVQDPSLPSCQCPLGDDADADLVCDADDVCPGGDDTVDADADGWPDACPLVVTPPAVPAAGTDQLWTATGATPSGRAMLLVGVPGATAVPACPGLVAGVAVNQRVDTAYADATGAVAFHRLVPPGAAGATWSFQAVDEATCRASAVVAVPY